MSKKRRPGEFCPADVGIDEDQSPASDSSMHRKPNTTSLWSMESATRPLDAAALAAAVEKRDLAGVRALLEAKVSPNGLGRFRESLLVESLRFNSTDIALALLDAGADPYFGPQWDAVWAAATYGSDVVLSRLLERPSERLRRKASRTR